jgi:hypothetical protein
MNVILRTDVQPISTAYSRQHTPAVTHTLSLARLMGGTRLELVTSTMSTWRSNQLS